MLMTDGRLSLLNLLADSPAGYDMSAIPSRLFPRHTKSGWSPQGAARWAGRYIEPVKAEGLVEIRYVHDRKTVFITKKGLEVLGR